MNDYCGKWDSKFDPDTGEWKEPQCTCHPSDCPYKDRPEKHAEDCDHN